MTTSRPRLYPAFFALFPLFGIASINPGWYRLQDVGVLAAIVLAAVAVCYGVAYVVVRYVVRAHHAADVASLVTLGMVAAFYLYEPIPVGPVKQWTIAHPGGIALLALALALALGALAWTARARGWRWRGPALPTLTRFFTVAGALLFTGSVARVAYHAVRAAVAIRCSVLVQELARPVAVRAGPPPFRGNTLPDIFVIVLDEYPSAEVLRERFGIDNRPFEDSLRAIGFRIPSALRSNYANTLMSVGSLLNFAQVAPLSDATGASSHDYTPAAYLIEHNRAAAFLRAHGYRYVFFPSAWYAPTRNSAIADEEFDSGAPVDLARAVYESEFATDYLHNTIFDRVMARLMPRLGVYRNDIVHTFDGVAVLPPSPRPTFALVHILMPHTPYYVNPACETVPQRRRERLALGDELQCLNRLTLRAVRRVIARRATPPVILIAGDHGTASLDPFRSMSAVPTVDQARERFRPLGAFYLPGGGAAMIPDTTSLVNILRYVLSYYFNADLAPLPNTMYYSHWASPYHLTEMDSAFRPRAHAAVAGQATPDSAVRRAPGSLRSRGAPLRGAARDSKLPVKRVIVQRTSQEPLE